MRRDNWRGENFIGNTSNIVHLWNILLKDHIDQLHQVSNVLFWCLSYEITSDKVIWMIVSRCYGDFSFTSYSVIVIYTVSDKAMERLNR